MGSVLKQTLYSRLTSNNLGLFITEALHPFLVFKKAGFDVDLVSETGTYQPDWLSQQKDWLNNEDRAIWEDHSSEFRSKLDNLLKPSDIDPGNVCPMYTRRRRHQLTYTGPTSTASSLLLQVTLL